MDFAFSEEQDEFRAVVRRFVEERWPVAEVRRLAETPAGFERGVWKQMGAELGLLGLAIPEAHGGQGFGFLEVGIALEELGRQLAGGPYLASAVLATQAILAAGDDAQRAEWLPALAAGRTAAHLTAIVGAIGASGELGLTWAVSRYALDIPWRPMPLLTTAGVLLTALVEAAVGLAASWEVLQKKPLATLRGE